MVNMDTADRPFALPNDERAMRARGVNTSAANAHYITDPPKNPDLEWFVRFKLPFSWDASKNLMYGRNARKHDRVYVRQRSRAYRDAITFLTRQALKGVALKHTKVWIDIFVEKAQNKGDAVNVVDLVCDGIKHAIPIDDRWYSLRGVDWAINKTDPHLFIGIGQEFGATDSKACQFCGGIKPLTEFTNDSDAYLKRGQVCVECRAPTYKKGPNKKYRLPA